MFPRRKASRSPVDWQARFGELAGQSGVALIRDYYRRGALAADTTLADVPMVALDLETTGLDPKRHGIVSIGMVPFSLRRIRPAQGYYRVLRPRREIDAHSITIHHITHHEITDAPDLEDVADELLEALSGRVAVVHYHAIERRFLYNAFLRRFGEGLMFPLVDTLQIEKIVTQRPTLNPMTWFGGRRVSLRLADARHRYRLPAYSPHHALTDALATAELFQAQVAYHGSPNDVVSEWWL
ncbi:MULTISPECIES: 3'-5' exonuclease [unclassified Wenzhouxiangella]|uniref:3'-5' exonuclease n=1 Tax=unclassified Wenzhouxiangella TaxID=2613841 RepID=UPI000E32A0B6|nr:MULTISPECIES: 3'-5' exonuclease [unclassified Wenzhouxiangella]RFF27346.1 3'-5' exonuclease [Wenzhouxiangella sp. 15181]RFP68895.1 3'-5' exonuclease [Wenzhouxiangella sp. 15190]